VVSPEFHTLRSQLWERNLRIRQMEVGILILSCHVALSPTQPLTLVSWQMDYEKSRRRQEQEEKLLISAWYSMVSGFLPREVMWVIDVIPGSHGSGRLTYPANYTISLGHGLGASGWGRARSCPCPVLLGTAKTGHQCSPWTPGAPGSEPPPH
jgi:hypothetical protein